VKFYASFGEWEVDIRLPNGAALGFDIPFTKVSGRVSLAKVSDTKSSEIPF